MSVKKPTKKQKIKKVLEFLSKNRLMSLATTNGRSPWNATVFYAYDNKFNIFFFSEEDTVHCKNIKKNPNVSVIINHAWKYPDGSIRGLQLAGKASKVSKKDYGQCHAIYKKRFKWADDFAHDHTLYIVRPTEVWYLDEKFFGHFYRVRVL